MRGHVHQSLLQSPARHADQVAFGLPAVSLPHPQPLDRRSYVARHVQEGRFPLAPEADREEDPLAEFELVRAIGPKACAG